MNNYRITVRYDGTRYKGWQKLGEDGGATVQARLEAVLSKLCGEPVSLTGSGRTDAGVHALAQIANFRTEQELLPKDILSYTLRYLPEDIVVTGAEKADSRFHARFHALSKTYVYRLDVGRFPDPFLRRYSWHVPDSLNYRQMRAAAELLIGTHDFSSFTNMKSKTKSAVRTLSSLEIAEPAAGREPLALIRMTADGFLHNMARIIAGTLVEAGLGERTPQSVAAVLAAVKRPEAGTRAPSCGLFLESVSYPES
jgi:tRNA pseudouridine38-40 synthase